MTLKEQRRIVAGIVDDLFTNGAGQQAEWLELITSERRNLGGWSKAGMAGRICELLKRLQFELKPKKGKK